MAAHSFHVLFCVVFENFYAITKILYINTSISKIIVDDLNVGLLPLGYTSATLRYPPLPAPL